MKDDVVLKAGIGGMIAALVFGVLMAAGGISGTYWMMVLGGVGLILTALAAPLLLAAVVAGVIADD